MDSRLRRNDGKKELFSGIKNMNEENTIKNLNEFIEKVDQMKKQDKMDLSSDQDLTIAIMNLVGIEEHLFFSSIIQNIHCNNRNDYKIQRADAHENKWKKIESKEGIDMSFRGIVNVVENFDRFPDAVGRRVARHILHKGSLGSVRKTEAYYGCIAHASIAARTPSFREINHYSFRYLRIFYIRLSTQKNVCPDTHEEGSGYSEDDKNNFFHLKIILARLTFW